MGSDRVFSALTLEEADALRVPAHLTTIASRISMTLANYSVAKDLGMDIQLSNPSESVFHLDCMNLY